MLFRASEIARLTGGALVGADVDVDGAAFDSRSLQPGQAFVPVRGGRDGHDFIATAIAAGASATFSARGAVDGFPTT